MVFMAEDDLLFKTKSFLKHYPRIFFFICNLSGVSVGKSAKKAIDYLPKDSVILNVGSGVKIIREDVINVDSYSYANVSFVADADSLPFSDNYADAIIAESLLEHVENPQIVIKEFHRVLKPNGLLYIITPFIIEYHSSPADYQRWTLPGLRKLAYSFEEKESGIMWGPTLALNHIFANWLALTVSLGSKKLFQLFFIFFLFLLSPLSVFDYILSLHPMSENTAHGFYFMGVKK